MISLDKNLLCYILEFCSPDDAINVNMLNKSLRLKTLNENLWLKYVRKYFGNVEKIDVDLENPTWFQVYIIFKKNLDQVDKISRQGIEKYHILSSRIMEITGYDNYWEECLSIGQVMKEIKFLQRCSYKCMLFPCDPIKIKPRKGDMIIDLEKLIIHDMKKELSLQAN